MRHTFRLILAFAAAMITPLHVQAQLAERADQVVALASVEPTQTTVAERVLLYIQVDNALFDPPELPEVDGLRIRFLNQTDQTFRSMSSVNGRTVTQTRYRRLFIYEAIPTRAGTIRIPSFTIVPPGLPGEPPRTRPLQIEVSGPERIDEVFVEMIGPNEPPYAGQPFDVTLRIGFQEGVARDATELNMPDGLGVFEPILPGDAISRRRVRGGTSFMGGPLTFTRTQERRDGRIYEVYSGRRTVIAGEPGQQTLGPVLLSLDFAPPGQNLTRFGRRAAVTSDPLIVEVLPLPSSGMPAGFDGLVGQYSARASASETRARIGDPIMLYLTVEGPDPITRVRPPDLRNMPGFETFRIDPEDTDAQYLDEVRAQAGGVAQALFTYLIRPTSDATTTIPAIELPYFDVELGRYGIARTEPIPLKMEASRSVNAADGEGALPALDARDTLESSAGGLMPNVIGDAALDKAPARLSAYMRNPAVLAAATLPPVAAAGALAFGAVRRGRAQQSPARLRASGLARAKATLELAQDTDAATIRLAVAHAASGVSQFSVSNADAATEADVRAMLDPIDTEMAHHAAALVARCDAATFAGVAAPELKRDAAELIRRIERATS